MRSCSGSPCLGTDGTLPRLWRGAFDGARWPRVDPLHNRQGWMLSPHRERSGPTTAHTHFPHCSRRGRRELSANLIASSRIAADTRSMLRVSAETVIGDGLL